MTNLPSAIQEIIALSNPLAPAASLLAMKQAWLSLESSIPDSARKTAVIDTMRHSSAFFALIAVTSALLDCKHWCEGYEVGVGHANNMVN